MSGGWSREWIECFHAKALKIVDVARHDYQIVHCGRSRDHRVLHEIVWSSMHETGPQTKCVGIHRQHVVSVGDPFKPSLDLGGLGRILLTRDLDTGLQLTNCHGGNMNI